MESTLAAETRHSVWLLQVATALDAQMAELYISPYAIMHMQYCIVHYVLELELRKIKGLNYLIQNCSKLYIHVVLQYIHVCIGTHSDIYTTRGRNLCCSKVEQAFII